MFVFIYHFPISLFIYFITSSLISTFSLFSSFCTLYLFISFHFISECCVSIILIHGRWIKSETKKLSMHLCCLMFTVHWLYLVTVCSVESAMFINSKAKNISLINKFTVREPGGASFYL